MEKQVKCRLCVKADKEYIPIRGDNPLRITEKINKLLKIEVHEKSCLPNVICLECLTKLNQFNTFFNMCQESQIILSLIYDEEKAEDQSTLPDNIHEEIPQGDLPEAPEQIKKEPLSSPKKSNTGASQISCYICKSIFPCNQKFKQHFQEAHREELLRYSCSVCFKTVLKYRSLTRHIDSHNSFKRFACDICDRSFSQKITLAQHLNTHTSLRTYKCECCGLTFKQNSSLFKHRKQKHSNVTFSCKDCNKSFVSNETLLQHQKSRHNMKKDINCSECQKTFASRSALNYHITSIHQSKEINEHLKCKFCLKNFKTFVILSRHTKKFHT